MKRLYRIACPAAAGSLALSACPPPGPELAGRLRDWTAAGIDEVVSLLTAPEADALGVAHEADACRAIGLAFRSFPIPDFGVPTDSRAFRRFAVALSERVAGGAGVAIHCRGGIGRSGTLAAAVLVLRGIAPEDAIRTVSEARGTTSPETAAQRAWLHRFADAPRAVAP